MSGNVREWCWDRSAAYTAGAKTDPTGAVSGTDDRVMRGGSWGGSTVNSRSVNRNYDVPVSRNSGIGFRVVRP